MESSIVGYQAIPVPSGWSLFTVTFKNIDSTPFDLRKIIPADESGTPYTSSRNKFFAQKMNLTTGALTDIYQYTTSSGKGWCTSDGDQLTDDTTIKFEYGEAMCVKNDQDGNSTMLVSGEVVLEPLSYLIKDEGYSLVGNSTPVKIDLRGVVPCNASGEKLTSSRNKILVQKMDAVSGALTDFYQYTTSGSKGWCDKNGNQLTEDTTIFFDAGESMCVTVSGQGEDVRFKFPTPIK